MKDVLISIKGYQSLPGMPEDPEFIELVTDGTYEYNDGTASFQYMGSELTGFAGTCTSFVVSPDLVVMNRAGTTNTEMIFERGKKHHFVYDTPIGIITMGVETHSIRNKLDEYGGDLEINYVIDVENKAISRNRFLINVK